MINNMEGPFLPFDPDEDKGAPQKPAKPAGAMRLRDIPLRTVFPNLLTLLAICSGLTSIKFAVETRFELAIGAIVIAAILDGLDGRVARLLRSATRFGAQMDSLADFVNFGVAPAMILYFWALNDAGHFGWICALVYSIGASLRLARFNVMLETKGLPDWQKNFFLGVPAPAAALIVLLPVYLGHLGLGGIGQFAHIIAFYALFVGYLMVSNIPTFSGKNFGKRIRSDLVLPMMFTVILSVALLISYTWQALALVSIAYLLGLPFGAVQWRKLAAKPTTDEAEKA